MSVVVISNQKGGVGKSTLTVLLAQWLAAKHAAAVCVVDLDSQCNCSKSLAHFGGVQEAAALFAIDALAVAEPVAEAAPEVSR